jgi:hypothetical protein
LPSPGNSTCSSATPNRSFSIPKYSTLTRTRPEYPQAHARAYVFPKGRPSAWLDTARDNRYLSAIPNGNNCPRPNYVQAAIVHVCIRRAARRPRN